MNEDYIHNRQINYDDNAKECIRYLEGHLNSREFDTIFDHARLHREAFFQDNLGHHYVIKYKEGEYYIEKG